MAANMIGYLKNIIIFSDTQKDIVLVNPKIIKKSGEYKTIEGCLSLDGQRETVRYRKIEVKYLDENFIPKKHVFQGTAAQIIQHECDHLEGILI